MKASGGIQVSPSWGLWEGMEAPGVGAFPCVYGHGEESDQEGGVPRSQAVLKAFGRHECPCCRI